MPDNPPIIAGARIGHVHLKVADLDRALSFYCGVLGFEELERFGLLLGIVDADGDQFEIAGCQPARQGDEVWELGDARGAPRRPDINQPDFIRAILDEFLHTGGVDLLEQ